VVEKIVDRPVDRIVEKVVEKIVDRPVDRIVEKIVEKPVDRIVEKTVEKLVPDTKGLEERDRQLADWRRRYGELEAQLRRAAEGPALDLEAAKSAGYSVKGADDLEIIEGIGPKIAELLRNAGIRTFAQLADTPTARIQSILDAGGGQYRIANPGTWAEQADLAARNRWTTLRQLQDVLDAGVRVDSQARSAATAGELAALKQQLAERDAELLRLRQGEPADHAAAKAAGFSLKGKGGAVDDLEIIEGIGPKIAGLLNDAGVTRFFQLAAMQPAQIQPILDAAGPAFKLARPDTWPEQAGLAARNQWVALKALQDALNAGNRS
jgi:predicted flap endonuclease-1-like 5' DNA nuclease